MIQTSKGMAQRDLPPIVDLLRSGHAYIKLSAPYRISQCTPNRDDVRVLNQLAYWVPEPEWRQRILVINPATLYGFDPLHRSRRFCQYLYL